MRATIYAVQLCMLIVMITACQPQAEQNIIEATTQAPEVTGAASAVSEVDAQDTAAPSVQPTLVPTPTYFSLPPVLGEPTETPLFTLTPTRIADPDMKLVEDMVKYITKLCQGDLNAREPFEDYEAYRYFHRTSPDGQLILFNIPIEDQETFGITDDVWVMNADGSNLRFLLNAGSIWSFEWIPGTHQFAFITGIGREGNNGLSGSYSDLHVIDADTGGHRVLLPPQGLEVYNDITGPRAISRLYPSPDGKHIALVSATSVSLIGMDGSNYQRDVLIYDLVMTYSEYNVFAYPVWAADSSGVWIAVPPLFEEAFIEVYFASICCGLRQAGRFQMDREDDGEIFGVNGTVASPTGEYVLYTIDGSLHLARTDGTSDETYYPDSAHTIRWIDATHFSFWIDEDYHLGAVGEEPQRQEAAYGCIP